MIRMGPIRQWHDAGSYGAQLAKRQRAQQEMYSNYSIIEEDLDDALPKDSARDSELKRAIEEAVSNCEFAVNEERKRGHTQEARRYEIKAKLILGNATHAEVNEYYKLLANMRRESPSSGRSNKSSPAERFFALVLMCGMGVAALVLGVNLSSGGEDSAIVGLIVGGLGILCIGIGIVQSTGALD